MRTMKTKIYYWYCPKCGKEETYAEGFETLHVAKIELEKHEAEVHKKATVGIFGQYWVK